MSYREGHFYSATDYRNQKNLTNNTVVNTISVDDYSIEDLKKMWRSTLENGIHGICFSMYEDGQEPGDHISKEQVERRIKILKPYTKWIRSFSCIEGNEYVPEHAHKYGLKTLVGAWLSDDKEKNEQEIKALIDLAQKGYVNIAAVGNEVMYRKELSEEELIGYIHRVKKALPNIPVGYVDAYYEFTARPAITDACDVILTNCYPFWEGCPIEYGIHHMNDMFHQAMSADASKKVIITETGWPNQGESFKASHPSDINAMKYFIDTQQWCEQHNIDCFYFSSFDESWKKGDEGEVGAYWGLWDKNERLKF